MSPPAPGDLNPLVAPVRRFVTELTPVLARLSPRMSEADVAVEAFSIAASFVDADGRHSDLELAALAIAFAPWLDHLVGATPAEMRANQLVDGKRPWKYQPSTMFEVLAANDRREGRRDSWRYYELAMLVAHATCAVDDPQPDELADLDRFRGLLLDAMRAVGVTSPYVTTGPGPGPGPEPGVNPASSGPDAHQVAGSLPEKEPVEKLLAELDALVGLGAVKAEVRLVANLLRVQQLRKEHGLPVVEGSRHLVFTGNPGTGKTTVARLLGRLYRSLGVVDKGQLVETDRAGMVAGYVGQTAQRTTAVIDSAVGGVLLIDEAYALARGDERDFGQEAIDTLVKLMEDHRDDLVVIAAGYPDLMAEFIDSNPGLRSRFPKTIHFEDYADDELLAIVELQCKASTYALTAEARDAVLAWFRSQPRGEGFGNARLARNLFEAMVARHASRVVDIKDPTTEDLCTLLPADLPAA